MVDLNFGSTLKIETLEKQLAILKDEEDRKQPTEVTFNLSNTTWVDIGALLFSINIMNYLKRKKTFLKIKLPEGGKGKKVRDFLKRWKFFDALEENVGQKETLIPPEQLHYLNEKQKYYLPSTIRDPYSNVEELLSKDLVEIKSFTDITTEKREVSIEKIKRYIDTLEKTTVTPVLKKCLGLNDVEIFSKNIIKEGLLNTLEHPDATISLLAMSKEGPNLVIGICDNGKPVPDTIEGAYFKKFPKEGVSTEKLIDFATLEGITSIEETDKRYISLDTKRGMGLFYLKKDSLRLGGYLQIRAKNALTTFKTTENNEIELKTQNVSQWTGNLIKIFLPLKK